MQIVIDIPEELYNNIQKDCGIYPYRLVYDAMKNGTPLPTDAVDRVTIKEYLESFGNIKTEQEPCEDVCERFEQSIDIVADIVEFRFSDGTVKRAKRGLYMRDIEESLRKMLIDQMANEKKQEPCEDAISRQSVTDSTICKGISCNECSFNTCEDRKSGCLLQERINKLPSVTPQPKMGRWIYEKRERLTNKTDECEVYETDYSDYWCKCSKCGGDFGYRKMKDAFCKYCGAKMQGVEG